MAFTPTFEFDAQKKNTSNNGENSTKKPFLELWEGLKSVKLVQIQHGTQAKISHKSQF